MLLIAAAAVAFSTAQPAQPSAGVSAQAIATIRVISGVRLSFTGPQTDPGIPVARQTTIHTADAQLQPARLIEFQ